MKLIPLDALLAEIDKRINTCLNQREEMIIADCEALAGDATARAGELQCLRDSIDTLEVKEVNLEKYYHDFLQKEWFDKICIRTMSEMMAFTAKHFFELGMRVNNPITAADRGMAEEIITHLKRVENDYRINLTKEMEWVRNKVQKGE